MRVLQICSAEGIGGGEVHVADLSIGLVERGMHVEIATRPASGLRDFVVRKLGSDTDFVWHQIPLRNATDLYSIRRLARIIAEQHIDIVHAHVARDYPVAALAATPGHRAALVLTRHHYLPIRGNVIYRRLLAKATIIAVSDSVRKTVCESLGVNSNRVVTIPNWVDLTQYAQPRERASARQAFGVTRRVAMALVGQIVPLKGHEEFLEAAAFVTRTRTDVEFLIAGEDSEPGKPFESWLRRRASELGLQNVLRFVGYQPDLPELFAAVDAVAVPSWNEAFGLVAAEAMAAGRAVIASRVGGLAELIDEGVTGLLVPPKDADQLGQAMLKLAESPALVEHLGHQARAGAHRFARGRGIEAVLQVYEQVRRTP